MYLPQVTVESRPRVAHIEPFRALRAFGCFEESTFHDRIHFDKRASDRDCHSYWPVHRLRAGKIPPRSHRHRRRRTVHCAGAGAGGSGHGGLFQLGAHHHRGNVHHFRGVGAHRGAGCHGPSGDRTGAKQADSGHCHLSRGDGRGVGLYEQHARGAGADPRGDPACTQPRVCAHAPADPSVLCGHSGGYLYADRHLDQHSGGRHRA